MGTIEFAVSQYDWRYLLEAAVLGVLSALTCFRAHVRAMHSTGAARAGWLVVCSLLGGFGIWAANSTIILSLNPGLPVRYDPVWAAASLLAALGIAAGAAPAAIRLSPWPAGIVTGLFSGIALALLPVISFNAWRTEAAISWDWTSLLLAPRSVRH